MRPQQRDVAGATLAEAEVVAHQHPAHAEPTHQHVLDELLGGQRRERRIEARDEHVRDAERPKRIELLAQSREARRGGVAREELARMRIERQHGGRQAQVVRGLEEAHEHGLVAAMDTVEVADGQGDRPGGDRRESAMDPHD